MTRRTATLTVASLLLVVLVCVAFLMPVPYVTMEPGPTLDTLGESDGKPLIDFGPGVETYPTTGSLALTTVSVTRPGTKVGLAQAFQAWFDRDAALVPRDLIYPPEQSAVEAEQQTQAEMSNSQATSEVAGLSEAGYEIDSYVKVSEVFPDSPAEGKLTPGDRIVAVDGEQVRTPEQVVAIITERSPGDPVSLQIRRDGDTQTVEVVTVADPEDESVARVGVGVEIGYDAPVDVVYNVNPKIGGPSAGAMFALAIYDKLTPGPLTGGAAVAGTGEIQADGTVLAIGGIQQKLSAAAESDTDVFLVPADNCDEAAAADLDLGGMRLVRVTALHDAVTSLETLSDDPDATVPTCG